MLRICSLDDGDGIRSATSIVRNVAAQENGLDATEKKVTTSPESDKVTRWLYDQSVRSIYLNNQWAAKNGNYLAQDRDELQTYYDLQMEYRYLGDSDLRGQLGLPKGQGILITGVKRDSMGNKMGFRKGDIVLRIADKPVDDQYKFVIAMRDYRGNKTQAYIRRQGNNEILEFKMPPVQEQQKVKQWILGVNVEPVSKVLQKHLRRGGLLILGVVENSPAEKMGLREHDVIVRVNQQNIAQLEDLRNELKKTNGARVTVELIREGNKMSVEMTPMQQEWNPEEAKHFSHQYWDLALPKQGGYQFAPADLDQDGRFDFYLLPKQPTGEDTQVNSELKMLSDKIDSIKKQLDELKELSKKEGAKK